MRTQVFKNMSHEDKVKSPKILTNVLHGSAHDLDSLFSKFDTTGRVFFDAAIFDIPAATELRERPKPWPYFQRIRKLNSI
jgi:hypothetical protein